MHNLCHVYCTSIHGKRQENKLINWLIVVFCFHNQLLNNLSLHSFRKEDIAENLAPCNNEKSREDEHK